MVSLESSKRALFAPKPSWRKAEVRETNAERYHFANFTRANYRHLLRIAKDKYPFRTYTNFNPDERFILWRHDVDFSMHAARTLARINSEEGIVATYFLSLHSELYNLLEREITQCVRDIVSSGQEIGLHFSPDYYGITCREELDTWLRYEAGILENIFGQKIRVFSFHNPTASTMGFREWQYAGLINTCAEFFHMQVGYCSDSNGYWRVRRLADVLRDARDERLQVLTHPEWWQPAAMSPRQRVHRCIDGRADNAKRWYDQMLKDAQRENVDWQ